MGSRLAGAVINECYIGDVRDGLRAMIAAGVRAQTCITSPPYWGLRDYGTAEWDGGDAKCDHAKPQSNTGHIAHTTLGGGLATNAAQVGGYKQACGKCGATRIDRQIGLEPTIAEYVATMVDVFRLVRDVLADDATLWLNLGDSYNAYNGGAGPSSSISAGASTTERPQLSTGYGLRSSGLKPKDLCGIPWRVAFALQADGWWLRQDMIWAKPNPMPESVTDRCTKAHEYLFLLSKRERYFYDNEAIKEAGSENPITEARNCRADAGLVGNHNLYGTPQGQSGNGGYKRTAEVTRNKRSVWTVTTQPYADAHFATFPRALVEPCILAGSRVGDVVLDPFMGSGTVGQVAQDLGRRWIGCELNPEYVAMQSKRTAQAGLELHL